MGREAATCGDSLAVVSALEQEMGFTMKSGRSLVQIINAPIVLPQSAPQLSLFGKPQEDFDRNS